MHTRRYKAQGGSVQFSTLYHIYDNFEKTLRTAAHLLLRKKSGDLEKSYGNENELPYYLS